MLGQARECVVRWLYTPFHEQAGANTLCARNFHRKSPTSSEIRCNENVKKRKKEKRKIKKKRRIKQRNDWLCFISSRSFITFRLHLDLFPGEKWIMYRSTIYRELKRVIRKIIRNGIRPIFSIHAWITWKIKRILHVHVSRSCNWSFKKLIAKTEIKLLFYPRTAFNVSRNHEN